MGKTPALRLFGVPALRLPSGAELVFTATRPFQMLAYLACRSGWVARDELAEWLWSDRPQSAARSNLRKVLLMAQKVPGLPPIEQQGDRLRWAPESDLTQFDAACNEHRHADALALYRPPLLQAIDGGLSVSATEWLGFERERVAARWRVAAAARLRELSETPERAAALAEALLREDPDDETALAALVHARAALGDVAGALGVLDTHQRRLGLALGIEPSAALRALAARLRQSASPAVSAAAVPRAVDPGFIGRRIELAQLRSWLLHEGCRVLTITGPGGVGKSSLARTALQSLAPAFADGAWWLGLDRVTDADAVPACLAAVMALELKGPAPPWRQLEQRIGNHRVLLVLDNAEHLLTLGPLLATLLTACPQLHLLNTSRSRISLPGEWLLPLEGLPLPDADETDADVLRRNDAVRLFEARALPASPAFDLAAQASDVVQLVHAVDGLPLAIELAAPWVRLLPVREIVAELAHSIDLLEGQGAVPVHERGLRASFARSWDLLSAVERGSLGRLAQLPGPFGREMARHVAGCRLPMLHALADQSLLRADGDGRFSLHPLVRQCVLERAGSADALRARHASYMGHWLARYGDRRNAPLKELLADIERELPHARAAWDWSVEHRAPEIVIRGRLALLMYFEDRGLGDEGIAMFERAAAAFEEAVPEQARAIGALLRAVTPLLYRRGRLQEAEASARRALRLALRTREAPAVKVSLNHLGLSLFEQGRHQEARHCFVQALRRARAEGEPFFYPAYTGNVAMADKALGSLDLAHEGFVQAVELHRGQGNLRGEIIQLFNAADICCTMQRWTAALLLLERAWAVCEQHDLSALRPMLLFGLGTAHAGLGRRERAHELLKRARTQAHAFDEPVMEVRVLLAHARLLADQHDQGAARRHLLDALAIAKRVGAAPTQLKCVVTYAHLLAAQGSSRAAAAWWQWLLRQPALEGDDRQGVAVSLGRLVSEAGELESCADCLPHTSAMASVLAQMRDDLAGCADLSASVWTAAQPSAP